MIFNFYTQFIPREFLVDTIHVHMTTYMYICTSMCYIKAAGIKTKHFIGIDILVLISQFVVVAILSEWWLVPTTVGTSLPLYNHYFNFQSILASCQQSE